jgi:signal transduction histidine kinase
VSAVRWTAGALFGRRARLRWVHLILGGALLMPYFLLTGAVIVGPLAAGERDVFSSLPLQLTAYALALPIVALTGLFPLVRPLSAAVVRALGGVPAGHLAAGPAGSAAARIRTAAWYTLHVALGGLISGATLAVPPFAAVLLALPLSRALRDSRFGVPGVFDGAGLALAPVAAVAMLVALAGAAALTGALLARCAPVLLGPTAADRLAAAEEWAAELARRNRLARELHDSVGHALSAVSLQASAARKVLNADREFVGEALSAIEETARRTVGELDAVVGLLREGDGPDADSGPALAGRGGLDDLLARTRAAGAVVDADTHGDLASLPKAVSREAYRIVQEGLGNALRHAAGAPVRLRIAVGERGLHITVENPMSRGPAARAGGGRGLPGIAERAALLHGTSWAGEVAGMWRLDVRLPVESAR